MTVLIPQLTSAVETPLPLKDLQLPNAISWWPLAPGWWLLAAFIIAAIIVLTLVIRQWWKSNQDRREARQLLKSVYAQWQAGGQSQEYLIQVNSTLKRFCRQRFPEALSLSGNAWVDFLNSSANTILFDAEVATALAHGAYQPQSKNPQIPAENIMQASLIWLKKASEKHRQEKL